MMKRAPFITCQNCILQYKIINRQIVLLRSLFRIITVTVNKNETVMISKQKRNIYIIHGYQASPNDHWFPWLSQQLNQSGHVSKRIILAESAQPNFAYWQKLLASQLSKLDANSIIIAHSLGCIAALHYLTDYFRQHRGKIRAGIFVAGFMSPLRALPELDSFIQQVNLDSSLLAKHIPLSVCLLSSNDTYVAPPQTIQLANFIQAQTVEIKNAGHFMANDGYTEFQRLYDVLKPLL